MTRRHQRLRRILLSLASAAIGFSVSTAAMQSVAADQPKEAVQQTLPPLPISLSGTVKKGQPRLNPFATGNANNEKHIAAPGSSKVSKPQWNPLARTGRIARPAASLPPAISSIGDLRQVSETVPSTLHLANAEAVSLIPITGVGSQMKPVGTDDAQSQPVVQAGETGPSSRPRVQLVRPRTLQVAQPELQPLPRLPQEIVPPGSQAAATIPQAEMQSVPAAPPVSNLKVASQGSSKPDSVAALLAAEASKPQPTQPTASQSDDQPELPAADSIAEELRKDSEPSIRDYLMGKTEQPVMFSLSDRSPAPQEDDTSAEADADPAKVLDPLPVAVTADDSQGANLVSKPEANPFAEDPGTLAEAEAAAEATAVAKTGEIEVPAPRGQAESVELPAVPVPVAEVKIAAPSRKPVAVRPSFQSGPAMIAAVPQSEARQAVGSLYEMRDIPDSAKMKPLKLNREEVRELTFDAKVQHIQIQDKAVCRVLPAGHSELRIVGTRPGITRMAVWTVESGDQPDIFEVRVSHASGSRVQGVDTVANLNAMLAEMFPASTMKIQQQGESLVVMGTCPNNETAKRVLRVVRKLCLVPVSDKLTVR